MRLLEKAAFFLLVITLPLQLGKHFWPEFSFVDGIRVDYLSPTIYLSDCAFILLFITSIWRLKERFFHLLTHPLFVSTLLLILFGIFISLSPLSGLYGVLKFIEFFYFAFYVASVYSLKHASTIRFLLVLGGLVQVVIATLQLYSQKSIGGLFYYLGERTFDASTPGIALFRWGDGLILRPYGTFPHPNVLAFFLLTTFVLLLFSMDLKNGRMALIKGVLLILLGFGIFITFSRVVFMLTLVIVVVWIIRFARGIKKSTRVRIALIALFVMLALITIFFQRFEASFIRDAALRIELMVIGFQVFIKNIFFGVGLNNFFYHEVSFQKQLTPTFLQPIHNIFLHWIVQTGIIGGLIMGVFLVKLFKQVKASRYTVLLVSAIVVGLFDHYLLTLQQGQLMLSLIIGLSFLEAKE